MPPVRRAAHFAHFEPDQGPEEGGNVHAGAADANARNLGPWSSAAALVDARADALEKRLRRKGAEDGDGAPPKRAGVAWKPSRDARLGPRCACPC